MNLGNLSQVFSLDQMSLCRLSSHGFYRITGEIVDQKRSGEHVKPCARAHHLDLIYISIMTIVTKTKHPVFQSFF